MNTNKHHPFSPSALERRDLCPGSWEVEAAIPDMTTPEAESGTRLHKAIADLINTNSLLMPENSGYTPEEAEICEKAVHLYHEEQARYGRICKVYVEQELEFFDEGQTEPLYRGTADVILVFPDSVTVIDWKTGFNPVQEAANNLQGAAYALAAMQHFSKSKAAVIFYNPRIGQRTAHDFTNWKGIRDEIKAIIDHCKSEPTLKPGENACKYCKGALSGSCPALQTQMLQFSVAEKAGLKERLDQMPIPQLLELFEASKPAMTIIESIRNKVIEVAEKEGHCGDYVIKMVSGGYECKDIQQTFRVSGLTPDKFLDCCSVSFPKLKKQYAEVNAGEGMTKKEAEAMLMDKIAPYLQAKPERKTLTKKKA